MMLAFLGEILIDNLSLPVDAGEDGSPARGPSGYADADEPEEPATADPAPRSAIEPPERRPDSRGVEVVGGGEGEGDDDLLVDAKGETKVMPLDAEYVVGLGEESEPLEEDRFKVDAGQLSACSPSAVVMEPSLLAEDRRRPLGGSNG
ncbi:BZ3500_MvSof-1268-A1-R1_Chr3-1g05629 [Microbotryum saponariae]|uniref:BZ3500_MvSof-1268-A1-R1_Chr3-1g05629 protein n=1 Tax=Microbotryum saponariae TaxID=289078 RepID=A0A2X0MWC2_9BASI|nr:BZ3500_MvSof-1268-A1-R1_Chr3-1g05629 [Microbotryum saponariae]SDA04819.1 BZ3501_MvSof-1269-A2-R1_Chr3-1g05299 [Microbotryum saponariae]